MPSESAGTRTSSDSLNTDLKALNTFLNNFLEKHKISFDESLQLLRQLQEKESIPTLIPSSIFHRRKLGILEAATKYLKEEHKLTYHQIAVLLKRDDRVVWVTYNKAARKSKERLSAEEPNVWIPVSVFSKKQGPLRAIATYLHDDAKMSFSEIAKLLNRDNRTIWAVYHKKPRKK